MKSKNHFFKRRFQTLVLFAAFTFNVNLQAQIDQQQYAVGSTQSFTSALSQSNKTGDGNGTAILLPVAQGKSLQGTVTMSKNDKNEQIFIGNIAGKKFNTFSLTVKSGVVSGHSILIDEKKAFKYSTIQGQVFVQEVDINTLVCVGYERGKDMPKQAVKTQSFKTEATVDVFNLQSLPGAKNCALLDFNGETVSGAAANFQHIVALPITGLSDAWILEAWEIVSEDYRPFNINITTSEAVFNSYSVLNRQRCVITETGDAVPKGYGGTAIRGSFGGIGQIPCWVINRESAVQMAETCSHEIGHTIGLVHQGFVKAPGDTLPYYTGQGVWAPIMGYSANKTVTQFSKGEYPLASSKQDQMAVLSSRLGYRTDDHGNTFATATALKITTVGNIGTVSPELNFGRIDRQTDLDFFSFVTNEANVALNFNGIARHSNLDIVVQLFDQSMKLLNTFNPTGLNCQLKQSLPAGKYYLSVDGGGEGNPLVDGYSDYASTGSFFISGSIIVNTPPTVSITNPVANKKYNTGAQVIISANAADVDGSISKVEFLIDNKLQATVVGTPYVFIWNATAGVHAIQAIAYDNNNKSTKSTFVSISASASYACNVAVWNTLTTYFPGDIVTVSGSNYFTTCLKTNTNINPTSTAGVGFWKLGSQCPQINLKPNVSITSPVNNSTIFLPSTVTISVNANDADGDVFKVEFFRNGLKVGEKKTSPYTITIPASTGQFRFTAAATDNEGATQFTQEVMVNFNTPPTVSITNPVANKIYNVGAPVTLSATAADVDGSILEVDFLVDNQLVGVVLKAPYTFVWKATPGVHAIKAVAYDNKNKSTQSAIINISASASSVCSGAAWNNTTTYYPGDLVWVPAYYYFVTCLKTNTNISPLTQASIGYWQTGNVCPQVNQKPTVTIISPVTNTTYLKPTTITLTASASDADGDVSKVVFRRAGIVVGEKTSRPFTVTFAAQAGVSFYTAQAFDNEGGSTSSAAVYVYSNFSDGCTVFPYDAYKYYSAGSLVSLSGNIYKANVATQNQIPAFYSGVGKPWTLVGACGTSFKTDAAEMSAVVETASSVLSLYPNPSNGMVTVNLEMQEQSNVTLKVLNVTGAEVAQRSYNAATSINEEMNLSHLSSGLYFVHVMVNDQLKVEKLVIE